MTENNLLLLIGWISIAPHLPPRIAIMFGVALCIAALILKAD